MKIGGGLNNENLIFGYDSQGFSFGGEPTTNLVPSPEHNSNFTIQNGWSTYNTNQYNSNTYFSIGTIGSVTNNIVTLSSVGRTIRSFDVLRPQTTGGGVTAGNNYVIKKISSTEFSLHEYNSSQNGSQGYINPDTGFFKVHDAYANDTRISINATDFPTMWWGPPHLPNSGLIKEIVPNEGRRHGTNAMRLHAYRPDGVADGMAYGVNTPVTLGDTVTVSVWLKISDSRGTGKSLGYSTYFGSGFAGSSTSFGPLTTQWKKYEYSWTASNTYSFISYWWPNSPTEPYSIDMCDFQVEVNKDEATKFVIGTRSNTEALLDQKNTYTIDTTNVGWTSDQYPTFNGSSHNINIGTIGGYSSNVTCEAVIKATGSASWKNIIAGGCGDILFTVNGTKLNFGCQCNSPIAHDNFSTTTINDDNYHHVVGTYDGSNIRIYVDGVLESTNAESGNFTPSNLRIGSNYVGSSEYYQGELPVVRLYNRTLSKEEVHQNYMSFKTRFGLS